MIGRTIEDLAIFYQDYVHNMVKDLDMTAESAKTIRKIMDELVESAMYISYNSFDPVSIDGLYGDQLKDAIILSSGMKVRTTKKGAVIYRSGRRVAKLSEWDPFNNAEHFSDLLFGIDYQVNEVSKTAFVVKSLSKSGEEIYTFGPTEEVAACRMFLRIVLDSDMVYLPLAFSAVVPEVDPKFEQYLTYMYSSRK